MISAALRQACWLLVFGFRFQNAIFVNLGFRSLSWTARAAANRMPCARARGSPCLRMQGQAELVPARSLVITNNRTLQPPACKRLSSDQCCALYGVYSWGFAARGAALGAASDSAYAGWRRIRLPTFRTASDIELSGTCQHGSGLDCTCGYSTGMGSSSLSSDQCYTSLVMLDLCK